MQSHFLHMLVYAVLVSTFFGTLFRDTLRDRLRLAGLLWLAMVGGALVLAFAMYPFPG